MPELGPVKLKLPQFKSGTIVGKSNVIAATRTALYEAAFQEWYDQVNAWMLRYFPYKTGNLYRQSKAAMASSTARRWYLASPVLYASYVNAMGPGTNWTNQETASPYFQQWIAFAQRIIKPIIVQALRNTGLSADLGFGGRSGGGASAAYDAIMEG